MTASSASPGPAHPMNAMLLDTIRLLSSSAAVIGPSVPDWPLNFALVDALFSSPTLAPSSVRIILRTRCQPAA